MNRHNFGKNIRSFKSMTPTIHETTYVDDSAVIIGDVTIDEQSSIWPCAVIRGDVQSISIGAYSSVQDNSTLHVTHDSQYTPGGNALVIGDYVTIAHGAVIHGCTIGNEVMVGMNATILDRAIVEDKVMIAAGAVVGPGKRLASGYLYVGSPIRQARELTDDELNFLNYVAANYAKLKEEYKSSS